MEPLAASPGWRLQWAQPKRLERSFELRSGETRFATLVFRSAFGTLATATTADGEWTFKRVGFLNPRVTVRRAGAQEDLAVYQPRLWGGGRLACADGSSFSWKAVNFWSTQWMFADPGGRPILTFREGTEDPKLADVLKTQAIVQFEGVDAAATSLSILVALGLYLILLHQQDGAAVAATAAYS